MIRKSGLSQSAAFNYSSSTPRAKCQPLLRFINTPSSIQMKYSGSTWKLLLLILQGLLMMLIFFELLVPSTSSVIETENYYLCVSWSAPRDLFISRWSIHGLSWVKSYLQCSKHFLVITTFLSLILCVTNYILVVHSLLTMCHPTISTINLVFHFCTWHTNIICHRLVKRLLVQVTAISPRQGTEHYGAMLNASERRRWYP